MKLGSMRKMKWFQKFRNHVHVYFVVTKDVIAQALIQNICHIPFWKIVLIKSIQCE